MIIRYTKEQIEAIIIEKIKEEFGNINFEVFTHTSGVNVYIGEED
jgi:ribosomal protein S24E